MSKTIAHSSTDDYTEEMAAMRRAFLKNQVGANRDNVRHCSIDASTFSTELYFFE